ncbi:MAG TPA: tetratricopeptide repeat protein [Sphingomicrobium sp.]|nr:tetratricopeptide repeat protein [Sphingomicrobium sp.]
MALLIVASPAAAKLKVALGDPGLVYLQARAASLTGDHARSAQLLTSLAQAQPSQIDLNRKAVSEAVNAGNMGLALQQARLTPAQSLSSDARLLLAADELRRNRPEKALPWLAARGDSMALDFLTPLVAAWSAVNRGDMNAALKTIDEVPVSSLLGPMRAEQRAFILIKFKKTADAEPFAQRAVATSGARESRLRLAFADGFLAAGDQARALAILDGLGTETEAARRRIQARKPSSQAVDSAAKALSEVMTAFAADVARLDRGPPPIGLVQIARFANPQNSSAAVLLALLLDGDGQSDQALAVLQTVRPDDSLIAQVRDIQVRILVDEKKFDEAYQLAWNRGSMPDATIGDFSRLGEVYQRMKRFPESADAYGRAITLAKAQGLKDELWPLLLLQASALEEAKRWPEARAALQQGLTIAPQQPLLLNFLGYAKLERGEDVDAAEEMIRKASELAPDDASITDSLGWAQYKRGKTADAIATLQRAAEKDPDQAEIQEHLGDALFISGRRYEARFAWAASMVTAEDEIAARVKGKLSAGLTPANAAP